MKLIVNKLHRPVSISSDWYADYDMGPRFIRAMPPARAADASHSSLLRVSTIGGIAIAALCVIYFVAEFLR